MTSPPPTLASAFTENVIAAVVVVATGVATESASKCASRLIGARFRKVAHGGYDILRVRRGAN